MATSITNPPNAATANKRSFDQFVARRLEQAGSQVKLVDLASGLLLVVAVFLGVLLAASVVDGWIVPLPMGVRVGILVALLGFALWELVQTIGPLLLRRINPAYAARMIEQSDPRFKNSLLNYVFLRDRRATQSAAVFEAVQEKAATDLSSIAIESAVDRSKLIKIGFALVGIAFAGGLYKLLSPKDPFATVARVIAPLADVPAPSRVRVLRVDPGSVEIFFGETVSVRADIRGVSSNTMVGLCYTTDDGQKVNATIPMTAGASKHEFVGVLSTSDAGIQQSLNYWIVAGDGRSSNYTVKVRPSPTIAVSSVDITPPAYTELPPVHLGAQADISALEGSKVRLEATANLPIASATLELLRQKPAGADQAAANAAEPAPPLAPMPSPTELDVVERLPMAASDRTSHVEWVLLRNGADPKFTHYRLKFSTADGQKNRHEPVYSIRIQPDIAPELEVLEPKQAKNRIPQNGKLNLVARAIDPDFRINAIRLIAVNRGKVILEQNLTLNPPTGVGNVEGRFILRPEAHALVAGDQIVFHLEAKDNRHSAISGQIDPNVTRSANFELEITPPLAGDRQSESEKSDSGQPDSDQGAGDDPNESGDQPSDSRDPSSKEQQGKNENNSKEQGDQAGGGGGSKQSQGEKSEQAGESNQGGGESDSAGDQNSSGKNGQQGKNSARPESDPQRKSGESGGKGSESERSQGDKPDQSEGMKSSNPTGDKSSEQNPGGESSSQKTESAPDSAQADPRSAPNQGADSTGENASGESASDPAQPDDANGSRQNARRSDSLNDRNNLEPSTANEGDRIDRPLDDSATEGERFEKLLDRMKREKEQPQNNADSRSSAGQPRDDRTPANGNSASERNDGPGRKNTDPRPDRDSDAPKQGNDSQSRPNDNEEKQGAGAKSESQQAEGMDNAAQNDPQGEAGESSDEKSANAKAETKSAGDSEAAAQSPEGKQQDSAAKGQNNPSDAAQAEKSNPSNESQPSSANNSGDAAQQQAADPSQSKSSSDSQASDKSSPADGPRRDSDPRNNQNAAGSSRPDGPQTQMPRSTDGNLSDTQPETAEEREKLEQSRKVTDLVLDYLKDQQHKPNAELLDEMNWTEQDLRDFLQRWAKLKQDAETGAAESQLRYSEALRSLGLRMGEVETRRQKQNADDVRDLKEDGAVSRPPDKYAEAFRDFSKGRAKQTNK